MPILYVIRHGQTGWNAQRRMQGQRNIPLNNVGRAQARAYARILSTMLTGLDHLDYVASPLGRARETMALIRTELGLKGEGYRLDPRLKEVKFGDWEGRTRDNLRKEAPELLAARDADGWNFCPPNGESYAHMSKRVASWLHSTREDTVMVAHGGVIRILQVLVAGAPRQHAPNLPAPQDRIMRIKDNRLEWI
ncbi:MAG TPA: histidine phosphatase family protein [Rhizobiales bacterium]|nr:histidine phosphatase family protein [Hyphomicrobiales bacterium]